jgi:hypothetical protein
MARPARQEKNLAIFNRRCDDFAIARSRQQLGKPAFDGAMLHDLLEKKIFDAGRKAPGLVLFAV